MSVKISSAKLISLYQKQPSPLLKALIKTRLATLDNKIKDLKIALKLHSAHPGRIHQLRGMMAASAAIHTIINEENLFNETH